MTQSARPMAVGVAAAALVLVGCLSLAWGDGDHEHDAAPEPVTLEGVVVDLHCYLSGGASDGHDKCANECIKKGLPAGLLVKDQVYLLLGTDKTPIRDIVAGQGGKSLTVTGIVHERGGMKALQFAKKKAADHGHDHGDHGHDHGDGGHKH